MSLSREQRSAFFFIVSAAGTQDRGANETCLGGFACGRRGPGMTFILSIEGLWCVGALYD